MKSVDLTANFIAKQILKKELQAGPEKMIPGMEHLSCNDRLRDLGLFIHSNHSPDHKAVVTLDVPALFPEK